LQCVVVYCGVLQYVAVCCIVLQCVTVFCSAVRSSPSISCYSWDEMNNMREKTKWDEMNNMSCYSFHLILSLFFILFTVFHFHAYNISSHTHPMSRWCMKSRRLLLTVSFHSCHLISALFISYPLHVYTIFSHTHSMFRCCTNSSLHPLFPFFHGISFCLFSFYLLYFICIHTTSSHIHFRCYGAAQIRDSSFYCFHSFFNIHPHAYIIFSHTHQVCCATLSAIACTSFPFIFPHT